MCHHKVPVLRFTPKFNLPCICLAGTDGSRHSTAPRATGTLKRSLRLRFSESPSNSAAIKTKNQPQSKQRNESYGRLKKGSRFLHHWSQGKHGPDQSHNRLILLSLSADFNGSAQVENCFATPFAGRFV